VTAWIAKVGGRTPPLLLKLQCGQAIQLGDLKEVSPAVRWQLRNATPPAGFGPGRLANLPDLHAYQSGPLLLDRGLLNDLEYQQFRERTPRIKNHHNPERSQRGLITVLDIAPDTAQGAARPGMGLEWLEE
jgi:hypothetical protein